MNNSRESESSTKEISCGQFYNATYTQIVLKACSIVKRTRIGSTGFTITNKDDTVKKLEINWNKKVSFLPIKVAESFQNLQMYAVRECSVKKITYKNFANLTKLLWLYLEANLIETIPTDAFKDLGSLEALGLSKSLDFDIYFIKHTQRSVFSGQ